jgi:hypothetical protein
VFGGPSQGNWIRRNPPEEVFHHQWYCKTSRREGKSYKDVLFLKNGEGGAKGNDTTASAP